MLAEYFRANKVLVQDLFQKMATLKCIAYILYLYLYLASSI